MEVARCHFRERCVHVNWHGSIYRCDQYLSYRLNIKPLQVLRAKLVLLLTNVQTAFEQLGCLVGRRACFGSEAALAGS
jgi:hypothetical protein